MVAADGSNERHKLAHGHSRCADQRAQRPRRDLAMLWDGQARNVPLFHKHGMTASLSVETPAGMFKGQRNVSP